MPNQTLLPEPAALFDDAETRAERTIAILRIVIAAALGLMLVLAVYGLRPSDEAVVTRQWLFAGVTLMGYLALGIASLTVNLLGRYRPWMAWVTVTGDCLFLLLNVWLSLLNTGLPAYYMISMPAIWLAPLALAFGALRFNPLLQAYMVALIVAGIAVMALMEPRWVFNIDDTPPPLLNAFFSPPPNIMRMAMFILAGVVLVVASVRARALLTHAINETRRGSNLTRYLPQQVADRLAETGLDELRRGRRQDVAILFVDMRGFTPLSESLTPEALSEFVGTFRQRITRAADSCGGTIDKYIGDAALVVFGLDRAGRNDADAAITCGRTMLEAFADWSRQRQGDGLPPVHVGIGVHWGEVFCGAVGDEARLEYTVLGDPVNVAARLQELTKEAGLSMIASSEVLAAAGHDPAATGWQTLPTMPLRGRRGTIAAYGTGGASPAA